MKTGKLLAALALLSITQSDLVLAQASSTYHPFLTDKFHVSAGVFFPNQDFELQADGVIPGDDIDFDQTVGIDDSKSTAALSMRWNFGEKWSFWGQWWSTDTSGSKVLNEDVEWEDLVFKQGTNVGAGVKNTVVRAFFGRKFSLGPQHEFGAGLGIHWLEIDAFIEGQAFINDAESGFQRGSVSSGAPLPNIGGWYYFSPSSRWLLSARLDWLSASIGDYKGSLWNSAVGVNFQMFEHMGIGLSYNAFQLDVDVDKSDWRGKAKISYHGPFLAITANW